jgi:hypothetical protein
VAQGLQYDTSITATSSGGGVAFTAPGSTSIELKARRVTVINTGSSSPVYVNFTTTSGATTGDWAVNAGSSERLTIEAGRGAHYTGLSYVSSSGAAPPFRVLAIR